MKRQTYRDRARPIIAEKLAAMNASQHPLKVVLKAMRLQYPWDAWGNPYRYRVWRDEVLRQLGVKRRLGSSVDQVHPNQVCMFGGAFCSKSCDDRCAKQRARNQGPA